jgi:hypothetical protein
MGTGGPSVGYGTRQTTARSPPRLGCAAHLQQDPGGWTNQVLLSRRESSKILIFQISIPLRFWDVLGYIDTHFN